jgi:hypothetical protein
VERFKDGSTWSDKTRLRAIAADDGIVGNREDRLTLELARYLHAAGLFVLVRPRISNLEPDIVGLQGIAVEAKAYADSSSARGDMLVVLGGRRGGSQTGNGERRIEGGSGSSRDREWHHLLAILV